MGLVPHYLTSPSVLICNIYLLLGELRNVSSQDFMFTYRRKKEPGHLLYERTRKVAFITCMALGGGKTPPLVIYVFQEYKCQGNGEILPPHSCRYQTERPVKFGKLPSKCALCDGYYGPHFDRQEHRREQ